MSAANGDFKVCPQCHSLLWHRDWSAEERQRKLEAAAIAEAERQEARRQREEASQERKAAAARIDQAITDETNDPDGTD